MKLIGIFLLCYLGGCFTSTLAQTSVNKDSLFTEAKKYAKIKDYHSAYRHLNTILNDREDNEVRFYLGLLYSWDGKYEDARREFSKVRSAMPQNHELTIAEINVEIWSDNTLKALEMVEIALTENPKDEEFLFKKAQLLSTLGHPDEAILILDDLLIKDPDNIKYKTLKNSILTENMKNRLSVNYVNEFVQNQSAWYSGNVQYSRKTPMGDIIGRINYASRFGLRGFQYEVDAYPKTGKTNYSYLNFGYSGADVFPKYRSGFEFFQKLPKSIEASLGFRYMRFGTQDVMVYTGSLGKYIGNYWFSVRPFLTSSAGKSPFITGILSARRYFRDAENYIGLQYGHGTSPDDSHLFLEKIYRLPSDKFRLTYNHRFFDFWFYSVSTAYEREQVFALPPEYRNRFIFDITVQRTF